VVAAGTGTKTTVLTNASFRSFEAKAFATIAQTVAATISVAASTKCFRQFIRRSDEIAEANVTRAPLF
jgi:hypothetical protein